MYENQRKYNNPNLHSYGLKVKASHLYAYGQGVNEDVQCPYNNYSHPYDIKVQASQPYDKGVYEGVSYGKWRHLYDNGPEDYRRRYDNNGRQRYGKHRYS